MLKERVIYGTLGFAAAVAVILQGSVALSIAVFALVVMALFEMYKSTGLLKKYKSLTAVGFMFAAAAMIFLLTAAIQDRINYSVFSKGVLQAMLAFGFVLMLFMIFMHETVRFSTVSMLFLETVYITVTFAHIILISGEKNGAFTVWLVFFGAWGADTFAYFAGKTFGRHKLIEKVSPKKTVEGALGGVLGSVLVYILYGVILAKNGVGINYINLAVTGVLAAVISQVGDLIMSCIKRENHIKDYGDIIPGHGGILDRFDSVLTVAPLIFYLNIYLPSIL